MNSSTSLPPRTNQEKQKGSKKKKIPKWLKIVLIAALVIAVAVMGVVGYFVWYTNDKLKDISTVVNQKDKGGAATENILSLNKEPFSFILLGIDYRPELPGRRTDVVMVGAVHPNTQEAVLVSLSRDTYVDLPGYHADKLAHYYPKFFSLKEQGKLDSTVPEDEMKLMLGKYMEVPIQHVAVINFKGFSDVVDAVGGVHVNVDQDMCYRDRVDGTRINLKQGSQTLDGKNTLDFVRYRKSNCRPLTKGTVETDRNLRQSAVLKEIIGKIQSLGGLTKGTDIIDAVADNLKIDMTPDQIRKLIMTYVGINRDNIHYISVGGEWVSPYVYPDKGKLEEGKQAIKDILAGKSLSAVQREASREQNKANSPAVRSVQ